MQKIENKFYNECYYVHTFSSGLKGYFMPKKGFKQTNAYVGVNFGSLYQEFEIDGKNYVTPAGIAHYLEHKMFNLKGNIDACSVFSKLGADANAYTTYDRTVYNFKTIENVDECINLLLDLVSELVINQETVDKERPIIAQELGMYLNNPNDQVGVHFLEQAYSENYVRTDIGGTVETIQQITPELLQFCFDNFYHPLNMGIAVVGNFDVEHMIDLIEKHQQAHTYPAYHNPKVNLHLNDKVLCHYKEYEMDINNYYIALGARIDRLEDQKLTPEEVFKTSIYIDLLQEILFNDSSKYYQNFIREKKVDYSFVTDFVFRSYSSNVVLYSNTFDPKKTLKTLKEIMTEVAKYPISKEAFEHYKNCKIASSIRKLNSMQSVASSILTMDMKGLEFFHAAEIVASVSYEEFLEVRKRFENLDLITTIIKPREENK